MMSALLAFYDSHPECADLAKATRLLHEKRYTFHKAKPFHRSSRLGPGSRTLYEYYPQTRVLRRFDHEV